MDRGVRGGKAGEVLSLRSQQLLPDPTASPLGCSLPAQFSGSPLSPCRALVCRDETNSTLFRVPASQPPPSLECLPWWSSPKDWAIP